MDHPEARPEAGRVASHRDFEIAGRRIGPGHRVYVIAEAGVNHDGDLTAALRLVRAAADVGADAVKFQAFDPMELASSSAETAEYQRRQGGGLSQQEMLAALVLTPTDFATLAEAAVDRGLDFLCTPFDVRSLEMLLELDVPAIKVSSGDLTHLGFLSIVGAAGRPVILSTGGSNLEEIEEAVEAVDGQGARWALLHCVTAYPAPDDQLNLRAIGTMRARFGDPIGFSDHSMGIGAGMAAVALGASILEKHLTLDRSRPGPDHAASLDVDGFRALVEGVRTVEVALGDGVKQPGPAEAEVIAVARRSIVADHDLVAGQVLRAEDLAVRRPGTGIPPKELGRLIGRVLRREVASGTPLGWEDVRSEADR